VFPPGARVERRKNGVQLCQGGERDDHAALENQELNFVGERAVGEGRVYHAELRLCAARNFDPLLTPFAPDHAACETNEHNIPDM
jgi:hypothetical protein